VLDKHGRTPRLGIGPCMGVFVFVAVGATKH
jgi:hypothetical protein